jgi:flagellin-like protein
MNYRKFRKNVKAISPVISVLLMIAVAVVASLVVYAWVMGYIGFQTSKTGEAVQIQSVAFSGTPGTSGKLLTVYLQNVGSTSLTLNQAQCLYVNGVLDAGTTAPTSLAAGGTATITPSTTNQQTYNSGTMITIKVTTTGGTYSQITQQVP